MSRKPKIVVLRRDPVSKRCVRVSDPVVEHLLLRGIPVTKASYLKFAFPGEQLTEPLDAEVRAELEEALEDAGALTWPNNAILERLAKVKASTPALQAKQLRLLQKLSNDLAAPDEATEVLKWQS